MPLEAAAAICETVGKQIFAEQLETDGKEETTDFKYDGVLRNPTTALSMEVVGSMTGRLSVDPPLNQVSELKTFLLQLKQSSSPWWPLLNLLFTLALPVELQRLLSG